MRSGTLGRRLGTGAGRILAHPAKAPGKSRQRVSMLVTIALVLVSVGVVAAVALTRGLSIGGGQDSSSAKDANAPTLEGKKLPEVGNFPPGQYVTDQFKPTMSFTLGGNGEWQIGAQLPDILNITPVDFVAPKGQPDLPPSLSIVSPREVYKPFDPSRDEELSPAPEDMVAWIRNHPDLKIEKTEPAIVGGVSGTQFDVSVVAENGSDALLFRVGGGSDFPLLNGNENRLIVLEDVVGETVVIVIEGTKAQMEGFLPEAQKVLDTVRFAAFPAGSAATKPKDATAAGISPPQTISAEGPIAPGKYHSDGFEPAVSFTVDKGWLPYGEELPDALAMALGNTRELERPSTFGFFSPRRVTDQTDPDRNTNVPAPESVDGWVKWFQKHPNLTTEEPVPVTVGGVSGVRIDALVSSEPEESQFPPAFWVLSNGVTMYDFVGVRSRTTILNVGGDTVLIDTSASSPDKFEELLPKAQKVLDTVEWKSAS
jgi:hypothetical protein